MGVNKDIPGEGQDLQTAVNCQVVQSISKPQRKARRKWITNFSKVEGDIAYKRDDIFASNLPELKDTGICSQESPKIASQQELGESLFLQKQLNSNTPNYESDISSLIDDLHISEEGITYTNRMKNVHNDSTGNEWI